MIRRGTKIRWAFALGAILLLLIPATLFIAARLRGPGAPIVIVNDGREPMNDVTLTYPGGIIHVDRLMPQGKIHAWANPEGEDVKLLKFTVEYHWAKGPVVKSRCGFTYLNERPSGLEFWLKVSPDKQENGSRYVWWKEIWNKLKKRLRPE
ncbi:MAG: hypothetical protein NVSMB14_04140 [Isosphaeraceae bacterium]